MDRSEQDDFISRTIKSVDSMLAGERAEQEKAIMQVPDDDDPLCWRCGEVESEHYGLEGWCAPLDPDHGRWDRRWDRRCFQQHPRSISDLSADEKAWFEQQMDEDDADAEAEWWSTHCPAHAGKLQADGSCAECEAEQAEERRVDL